jgi:ring-1,2-phenylacetyl-CoA epoxidase subunit PaaE
VTTIQDAVEPALSSKVRRNKLFQKLRVTAVDRLCDDAAAVTFDIPDSLKQDFNFQPGQSLTLRRMVDGAEQRRSYSICAPVGEPLRIGVREIPGGLFSNWLARHVAPGDEVEVQTPSGTFTADPDVAGHHVLIAAGSGITPVLSIASSVLANPASHVTVFYGNRRSSSVMFVEELSDLKDTYGSRLELIHVLSQEPRRADLFTGRLDATRLRSLLTALVPVAAVDHFWLCGPFGMVTDAQDVLRELGVADDRIHQELFFVEVEAPKQARQEGDVSKGHTSAVTVIMDGRSSTMNLARERSVLDSAQTHRDDLPYACKGGVCGTCRAKVTTGEIEMRRNYALETFEVEAGFVLTCQSFPISETVTVDFDA